MDIKHLPRVSEINNIIDGLQRIIDSKEAVRFSDCFWRVPFDKSKKIRQALIETQNELKDELKTLGVRI